jgi:bidirectional [NiFe] hydrogenase diaphorase subunit
MTLEALKQQAEALQQQQKPLEVSVCVSASCISLNSQKLAETLEQEVRQQGLEAVCQLRKVGCRGLCSRGPLGAVRRREERVLLQHLALEDAPRLVAELKDGQPVLLEKQLSFQTAFFARQRPVVTEHIGSIDPEKLEDYLAVGGYQSLLAALTERSPSQVVDEVLASGLRGRGGAGYSTGLKWRTVAKAQGAPKYVICNGDEGDPGAYMNRSVLESDPHRVLEGMAIAAYAVGASLGYLYVRAEYPLAIERLKKAIRQAERQGLLGQNIGGTDFNFAVEVRLGAGAYVCGEETALLASIEGGRGLPRPRPPYPAEKGLFGRPTLINNVETFANIPSILRHGAAWFARLGTEKSRGTKVFALAGKIVNVGLVEVPMGMTLREIIFDLGGGIPDGDHFKAVQTGGPSGGCIPADYLDSPVDYESLTALGSIMGSGGMIVMGSDTCMVDVARYFMGFCRDESCGKCVPCRVGTVQLYGLLDKISQGQATASDLALLEELCELVQQTSLCGLGQSAPNPVLSTLRYFPQEYQAHLHGNCPAGVCNMTKEAVV